MLYEWISVMNIVIYISISHTININIPEVCPDTEYLHHQFGRKMKTLIVRMDADLNDTNHDADGTFISCFIRDSGEHSFTIISNMEFNFQTWRMLRRVRIIEPNIMIFTNFPNVMILEKQIINIMFRSKWSLTVIIATTTNTKYKCNETNINAEMFSMLDKFADDLWQKFQIVNVLIHFPFVCPHVFISYGNKTNLDTNTLYQRPLSLTPLKQGLKLLSKGRCKDLTRDYPLRTSISERFPTSITGKDCNGITNYLQFKKELSSGFCGLDGLIMADIVEYFGFNITKRQFDAAKTYGYVDKNGRVTGSLGNIVRGEIDVSFNSRFMAPYGVTGFNFLNYISSDSLCAIIKRSEEVPLWLFPYDVYSCIMWTLLLTTLTIVGIFLWLSAKCSNSEFKKARFQRFIVDSMVTGLFGFSSMKSKFLILKGVCFFSSVIFTAMFQSHVNYAYTTLVRYRQVNNLQDLDETGSSLITSSGILNLINPPLNDLHASLMSKAVIDDNFTFSYPEIMIVRRDASLGRRSDMILQTLKYFTDENGQPLFHVVGECFKGFFLSFISNKDFPFSDDIIILVERLIEAGLPEQYYQWTQWSLGLLDPAGRPQDPVPRPTSPIYFPDLRIAFSLLAIGYFISIVTLILEKYLV